MIGECPATCGGGLQFDYREKIQEELFGGNPCEGEEYRHGECNVNACPGITCFKTVINLVVRTNN